MLRSFAGYALVAVVAIGASVSMAQSKAEAPAYLDNRSTPEQLVLSYFNAIDRHEYARAYSYYGPENAPKFASWQFHYDDVVRTEVTFGEMAQGGAAGSIYYQLPVTVTLDHAEGDKHVERGCFSIRWVTPAYQAEPPFQPMYIISNELKVEDGTAGFAPAKCD